MKKELEDLQIEALRLYNAATRLYIKSFGEEGVKVLTSLPGEPPPPPPPPSGGH